MAKAKVSAKAATAKPIRALAPRGVATAAQPTKPLMTLGRPNGTKAQRVKLAVARMNNAKSINKFHRAPKNKAGAGAGGGGG